MEYDPPNTTSTVQEIIRFLNMESLGGKQIFVLKFNIAKFMWPYSELPDQKGTSAFRSKVRIDPRKEWGVLVLPLRKLFILFFFFYKT